MEQRPFKVGDKAKFLGNISGVILEIDKARENPILWASDSGIQMRFTIDGELSDYKGISLLVDKSDYSQNIDRLSLKLSDNQ